jgi:hypothetical protein
MRAAKSAFMTALVMLQVARGNDKAGWKESVIFSISISRRYIPKYQWIAAAANPLAGIPPPFVAFFLKTAGLRPLLTPKVNES